MLTLFIDTSGNVLHCALIENKKIVNEIKEHAKNDHSTRLVPAIDKLLKENKKAVNDIKRIVVTKGPGSFTGVRIGITVAKTLAWSLNIPVASVSTLEAIGGQVDNGIIVPIIDAKRNNVFAGVYKYEDNKLRGLKEDTLIDFDELLTNINQYQEVIIIGNDVNKYSDKLAAYDYNVITLEDNILDINKVIANCEFNDVENINQFVPTYLKLTDAEINWLKEQDNA